MIYKLAGYYACGNAAAKDELVDFGIVALQEFLVQHAADLTLKLLESDEFRLTVSNYLWSEIGHEAKRLSTKSGLMTKFSAKTENADSKRKVKTTVDFFGVMQPDCDLEGQSCSGEFFNHEIADERAEYDIRMTELLCDIKQLLTDEQYTLFAKVLAGTKVEDLAAQYGVSAAAISQRLNTIRKKLMPYGESLRVA